MLLAIELTLLCHMCDLYFKFEENRTKLWLLSRAIGTSGEKTVRRTDRLKLQVILYSVQCHELHWTDKITKKQRTKSVSFHLKYWLKLTYPVVALTCMLMTTAHCAVGAQRRRMTSCLKCMVRWGPLFYSSVTLVKPLLTII